MDSTPRQIWLQQLLGYPLPAYLHIPVANNDRGQKLSKSSGAGAVSLQRPAETLFTALAALGQHPPADLRTAALRDIWEWAQAHWRIEVLAGLTQVSLGQISMAEHENGLS